MKRRRYFSTVDTERFLTSSAAAQAVSRYLVVQRKEGDFTKVNLFLIGKAVIGCPGPAVQDIRKSAGGLLVESLNDQQGSRLIKMQKIGDIEVDVVPHTTLNTTKGVRAVSYTHLCT